MTPVLLGLGTNIGDRLEFLKTAIHKIKELDIKEFHISSVYETPALLKPDSPIEWNKPYLNLVLFFKYKKKEHTLLREIQNIEKKLGKSHNSQKKWAPRSIDIDILFFGSLKVHSPELIIPHPEIEKRNFVLSPLRDLEKYFYKDFDFTFIKRNRKLKNPLPQWMHILNFTPDSFSDGGGLHSHALISEELKKLTQNPPAIIDIGAESTRPGARTIPPDEEWQRLIPFFEVWEKDYKKEMPFTKISIDTRNPSTAYKALQKGATMVNDVSATSDPEMLSLLREFQCEYIFMHNLGLPANPEKVLPKKENPVKLLTIWLEEKLNFYEKSSIKKENLIFDPGIGFGKSAEQSLLILKNLKTFLEFDLQTLVGHSRKSFSKIFSTHSSLKKDPESIGISLKLAQLGIDIIRVHDFQKHQRAHLAALHIC